MLPILIPLFLLLAPSPTQEIGGGSELLFEWDGGRAVDYLGHSVSGAGDVNGDGYDDLIIGAYAATRLVFKMLVLRIFTRGWMDPLSICWKVPSIQAGLDIRSLEQEM